MRFTMSVSSCMDTELQEDIKAFASQRKVVVLEDVPVGARLKRQVHVHNYFVFVKDRLVASQIADAHPIFPPVDEVLALVLVLLNRLLGDAWITNAATRENIKIVKALEYRKNLISFSRSASSSFRYSIRNSCSSLYIIEN